jgi:hypothetical protein
MKNKFKFIDGSILVLDENDLNHAAWETCNNLVHTGKHAITPSISQSLVFIQNAIDVCNNIRDQFIEDVLLELRNYITKLGICTMEIINFRLFYLIERIMR